MPLNPPQPRRWVADNAPPSPRALLPIGGPTPYGDPFIPALSGILTSLADGSVAVLPSAGSVYAGDDAAFINTAYQYTDRVRLIPGLTYLCQSTVQVSGEANSILGGGSTTDTNCCNLQAAGGFTGPVLVLSGLGAEAHDLSVQGGGTATALIQVTANDCKLWGCGTSNPSTMSPSICLDIQAGGTSCWVIGGKYNGHEATSTGISIESTDAIVSLTKPVNHQVGILLTGSCGGAQIIGNHITAGDNGVNDLWYTGTGSTILIAHNRFDNCPSSPIQLSPPGFSSGMQIIGNIFNTDQMGAFPLIGYDTSNGDVGTLMIEQNGSRITGGVNIPTWFLDATTRVGAAATNTGRVASAGTLVSGNVAWVQNAGFYHVAPTMARGNMVSINGSAWSAVADI